MEIGKGCAHYEGKGREGDVCVCVGEREREREEMREREVDGRSIRCILRRDERTREWSID